MKTAMKFDELGLSTEMLEVLKKRGFEEPTPIQSQAIPVLLQTGLDIIGQAQTGTGKTAAFALPILEKIRDDLPHVQALILTPTRELAVQVSDEIAAFKGDRKYSVIPIYGGQHIAEQIRHLKKSSQIVVGTPGRILDHLRRRTLKLGGINFLVLDEADEMLNMGFVEDVEEIMAACNEKKQVALFSATMPERIEALAQKYMRETKRIKVKNQQVTANLTEQLYFEVRTQDRFEVLCRIIDMEEEFYGLVFCRTKVDVDEITARLIARGYDADCIHGDITQKQREKVLNKFKNKKSNILVATDVAARGLDINNLNHVINYALPQEAEAYVHRIGRTGRAGKKGVAITFITPSEYRKLAFIQRLAKADIRKEQIPEVAEIMEVKRNRIMEEIKQAMEAGRLEAFHDMAFGMLNKYPVEELVPAMLKLIIQDRLDVSQYTEIAKPSGGSAGREKTRLCLALGRAQGYSPKKIIEFIKKETGLRDRFIDDLMVRDEFSFFMAPAKDAEAMIKKCKDENGRPLFVKAEGNEKKAPAKKKHQDKERHRHLEPVGREKHREKDRKKKKDKKQRDKKSEKKSNPGRHKEKKRKAGRIKKNKK